MTIERGNSHNLGSGALVKKHLMIAIDWYGPYSLSEAYEAARTSFEPALYLCIGKRKYQRKKALQYVGIGKNVSTRIKENHHKLKHVSREREIWLGEIGTAEPSGKKMKATPATLDYAEWAYARFFDLPLNEKKTTGLPDRSFSVLNRWWMTDFETARKRRPHGDWPDLIDYPDYDLPARKVWFGRQQQELIHAPDYQRPGNPPLRGLNAPAVEDLSTEDKVLTFR
ncbi:hypothetical protein PVT71_17370 [Salipiger sp. H15]|uniref:GIY-YIG nuclease family protein n=1 Tax=Alloyangia sp. H15 TaxID=3029062 RepID=A0AAU8AN59_9RHOB